MCFIELKLFPEEIYGWYIQESKCIVITNHSLILWYYKKTIKFFNLKFLTTDEITKEIRSTFIIISLCQDLRHVSCIIPLRYSAIYWPFLFVVTPCSVLFRFCLRRSTPRFKSVYSRVFPTVMLIIYFSLKNTNIIYIF